MTIEASIFRQPMTHALNILAPPSCHDCGLCCERNGSPPLVYQSRAEAGEVHRHRPDGLPQELIDEIDELFLGLARGEEPAGPCVWYDAELKRCGHYEWRPQVCVDYELGGPACLEERRLTRILTEHPAK